MPRHQIVQLPIMLFAGSMISLFFTDIKVKTVSWGISALIFIMATLIFWMIPRSIDLTIVYPWFNRIMHINMIIVGFLIPTVLPYTLFEIRIAFLLMISGMLITIGASLRTFTILLCSSFTIDQQKETGLYLLIIGILLFISTLIFFFNGLSRAKQKEQNEQADT